VEVRLLDVQVEAVVVGDHQARGADRRPARDVDARARHRQVDAEARRRIAGLAPGGTGDDGDDGDGGDDDEQRAPRHHAITACESVAPRPIGDPVAHGVPSTCVATTAAVTPPTTTTPTIVHSHQAL